MASNSYTSKGSTLKIKLEHAICIGLLLSSTADPGVVSLISAPSQFFVEIDHKIISTVILLLPLIQEGLLSVTRESMCTKYCLTD